MKDPIRIGKTIVFNRGLVHIVMRATSIEHPDAQFIVKLGTAEEVSVPKDEAMRIIKDAQLESQPEGYWHNPNTHLTVGIGTGKPDFRLDELLGIQELDGGRSNICVIDGNIFVNREIEAVAAEIYLKRYQSKQIDQ